MKKLVILVMVMVTMVAAFTGCKTQKENHENEDLRILTSYIDVEDSSYDGAETTIFTFLNRESAEDFMYYWLDRGRTVGGVIEHTDTGYFTVEVVESRFDEICRETVRVMGGQSGLIENKWVR